MQVIKDVKGADLAVKVDTADEFKKAVLATLMDQESVPLINIWWSNTTKKLNYSVGSGVTNADERQKKYLMATIGRILEENGLLKI